MSINKETHTVITATLSREVATKYKELCKKERRSVSNLTAILIEEYIKKEEKK